MTDGSGRRTDGSVRRTDGTVRRLDGFVSGGGGDSVHWPYGSVTSLSS